MTTGILNFNGAETGSKVECVSSTALYSGVSSDVKRSGNYSFLINPPDANVGSINIQGIDANGASVAFNVATIYARFYLLPDVIPASDSEEIFTSLNTSSARKFSLRITSTGKLQAYGPDGTTQLGSDGATTIQDWDQIEVKVGTGETAAYEVLVNGSVELSGTANLGTVNNGTLQLGKVVNRNDQGVTLYYDDICVRDDQYPGAGAVALQRPVADGTYTAWTVGAGPDDKWDCVDETPPDDTTSYLLSTASVDDAYTANLQDASVAGISGTINAVKSFARMRRAGSFDGTLKLRLRSGTTDADTAAFTNGSSSWNTRWPLFLVDPATSAAWSLSALDSLQVGAVEANATRQSILSATYTMVEYTAVGSASESPSASVSPSASISPSASESPSVSPSVSPSASISPSASESSSVSPSASESPSISPSASASPSEPIQGSVVWGHITGALEDNIRTFAGNWTGTGAIENSGDAERVALEAGEYMVGEVVDTGTQTVELLQNEYAIGDDVILEYRHGATQAACEAAGWNAYTVPFASAGFVQVRLESTL